MSQRVAPVESTVSDGGDSIAKSDMSQRVAGPESTVSDSGDPIANDSISQRVAVVESIFSDFGDRIGDDNLRQRVAVPESTISDGGDRIGDNIRGIRFSFGIGMEQSSILGEEDSLYRLIRGIILTYLNLRQRPESPSAICSRRKHSFR